MQKVSDTRLKGHGPAYLSLLLQPNISAASVEDIELVRGIVHVQQAAWLVSRVCMMMEWTYSIEWGWSSTLVQYFVLFYLIFLSFR